MPRAYGGFFVPGKPTRQKRLTAFPRLLPALLLPQLLHRRLKRAGREPGFPLDEAVEVGAGGKAHLLRRPLNRHLRVLKQAPQPLQLAYGDVAPERLARLHAEHPVQIVAVVARQVAQLRQAEVVLQVLLNVAL